MKKLLIAASLFLTSFSGYSSDALGDFIQTLPTVHQLPLQKATVSPPGKVPTYIADLDKLTYKQKQVLAYSYKVGNRYTNNDKQLGYHLAAIAWIESRACENTGKGKKNHHAVGCWQVMYSSASKRMESTSKKSAVAHLETLRGGSEYAIYELEYWLDYHKGDLTKALASYNKGFNFKNKSAREYARMVNHTARILEEHRII